MYDPEPTLLPRWSLIGWAAVYMLPVIAFIVLIASGYLHTPAEQTPLFIKLIQPMRLETFSLFVCLGIVWLAHLSRRAKIRWTIISLVAVFLQMIVLSLVMTFWFMAHIPKD